MLQYMEHAGVVPGQGFKGYAKGFVFIRSFNPDGLQAGFVVGKLYKRTVKLGQVADTCDREAMDFFVNCHFAFFPFRVI